MNRKKSYNLLIISGFSFLILLIIAISLLGGFGLNRSKTLFRTTCQVSFQVLTETEQANADLISEHRAMKDVALAKTDEQRLAALSDVDHYDLRIRNYFADMTGTERDNPLLADVIKAYEDWVPIRTRALENGQNDESDENTRTKTTDQIQLISDKMQLLIQQKKNDANSAYEQTEYTSMVSERLLVWMPCTIVSKYSGATAR
jgi:hypothetical protein